MVLVLSQVGQLGEVAEGADDQDGPAGAEVPEQDLQGLAGPGVLGPMEAHGTLPDLLDEVEGRFPFLLPDSVAQNPAQETDVLLERQVLVGGAEYHGAAPFKGAVD